MALYRIVEPCGGSIRIDGIDVATIGLRDLRSRLSLVPQVRRSVLYSRIGSWIGAAISLICSVAGVTDSQMATPLYNSQLLNVAESSARVKLKSRNI